MNDYLLVGYQSGIIHVFHLPLSSKPTEGYFPMVSIDSGEVEPLVKQVVDTVRVSWPIVSLFAEPVGDSNHLLIFAGRGYGSDIYYFKQKAEKCGIEFP